MDASKALSYLDQFVKLFLTVRSIERITIYTEHQAQLASDDTCKIPSNPLTQHIQNPTIAHALSGNIARMIDSSNKLIQLSNLFAKYSGNQAELLIAATSLTASANTAAQSYKIETNRTTYINKIKEIAHDLNNHQCPNILPIQLFALAKQTWETKSEYFYMTMPETLSTLASFLAVNGLKLYTGMMPISQIIPTIAAFSPIIYSRISYHSYMETKTNTEQNFATTILTKLIENCLDEQYLNEHYRCDESKVTAESLLAGHCTEYQ